MKSKLKSFLKILSLVLLSILLLFNIFAISYRQFNKDEENKVTSLIPFAVLSVESGSMEPEISKGDLVLIYEAPYEDIKVGDNITYLGIDDLITHKVVEINEEYFICKGLDNNVNDEAVLKEGYCGKVILAIPFLGEILTILDTPTSQIILILLVFFAFYGFDLINYFIDLITHKNEKNKFKITFEKPLVMLTTMSVILMSPYFTAGKYNKEVNGYTMAVGGATYFTANYLSEKGNTYTIGGWDGSAFNMVLDFRNYENTLLYNMDGQDILYEFYVEKDTGTYQDSEGVTRNYKENYTVDVTPYTGISVYEGDKEFVKPSEDWGSNAYVVKGPYLIEGSDTTRTIQEFNIKIEKSSTLIGEGETEARIKFKIVAATSANEMFTRQILGTFEFIVTNEGQFFSVQRSDVENIVTYTVITNDTAESNNRKIKVTWNPDELYLNEYDPSVISIINDHSYNYYSRTGGYIILPMTSDSKISLQFFAMEGKTSTSAVINAAEYHDPAENS